jgi:aminopeptidase N
MLIALLLALQGPGPLGVRVDTARPNQDVLNYDIALSIPDAGAAIRARCVVRYVLVGSGGPLRLDFDTTFTIDSLLLTDTHGRSTLATQFQWLFARDGALTMRNPGARGDTLGVTIVYHGIPQDGLFIKQNVHGERAAFADNWPNRAHHWFPSSDHPRDKATVTFAVEVPSRWRAIANGDLVSVDTLPGGRTRWRWREQRRIPVYTMVIGAGRLSVSPLPSDLGPPLSVWTFPQDSAFAVNGPFKRAGVIIDALTRLVGAFPYEKLAHVESSTRFGGMENSSAIFYDEKKYHDHTMDEGTVAHETAHQWFGDAVTEADWHHLWLSEGFASYFGPLFLQAVGDTAGFRRRLEDERRTYLSSTDVERPVIDTAQHDLFKLLNRNNYQKGALILHMLRRDVGDSAFFGGIRAYYATFRDSTVLSSDFAAVMERSAGRSLQDFFRQWLLQPGYPRLRWTTKCTDGHLAIEIEQVQREEWGLWTMDLPADIGGTRTTIPVRGRLTTFAYASCGGPTLDPGRDYLVELERAAY